MTLSMTVTLTVTLSVFVKLYSTVVAHIIFGAFFNVDLFTNVAQDVGLIISRARKRKWKESQCSTSLLDFTGS